MTVAKLIELLKKHDPDMPVIVNGYEGGFDDIARIEEVTISLNYHERDYLGTHEHYSTAEKEHSPSYAPKPVKALLLPRREG